MSALPKHIEEIHPSLWRANQLARQVGRVVPTGYDNLSTELPGGGWPVGALTELLLQQPGIGEMRLLQPALTQVSKRPIVLIKPPHEPSGHGLHHIGIPIEKLLLLKTETSADTLWSAEQVLKAGTCGAVLMWQQHMRADALRRLSLASQSAETMLFILRPLAVQQDASPAALRIGLRPSTRGVMIDIVKRKGPLGTEPFEVVLKHSPILFSEHGRMTRQPTKVARKLTPLPIPVSVLDDDA
ncbi:translesion DNA synthesis-associated protein ImuA [Paraburkholderia sp. BCC1886]|uniref:translesion DNA synthesis-associated protein ImuA n=1 Tax=Paraburkholderia sp. BCC1886 TaxID=2562670 RepID=UPI0011829A1D|nr:translesion DNA synthesis-associated protein ImuA [Paraburkholderia sp. BCC1886]